MVEYLLSQGANTHNNQYDQEATPLALTYQTKKSALPNDIGEEDNGEVFTDTVIAGNWKTICKDDITLTLEANKYNDTVLTIAARKGCLKYTRCLLKASASVNSKNILVDTALHITAQYGFR